MPTTVFLSYCHADEAWKDRLVKHLSGLERDGRLRVWNDRRIRAGQTWLQEIETAMGEARVAVLLVSPDFLASTFIQTREVPRLLERRAREGVHVVPVIVKDCLWDEEVRISELQARPRDGRALESFTGAKRNTELKKIAKEILDLLRDGAPPPPPELVSEAAAGLRPLHQLPPPPADFTGRTVELAELREAATRGGVTISGVAASVRPRSLSRSPGSLRLSTPTPRSISTSRASAPTPCPRPRPWRT